MRIGSQIIRIMRLNPDGITRRQDGISVQKCLNRPSMAPHQLRLRLYLN